MTRAVAVKLTLVVATLTTIATSAPEENIMFDVADQTVASGTFRVSVLANRAAVNHADDISLSLELVSATGATATVVVVADDPRYAPEQLEAGATPVRVTYDLTALCPRDRDCDAGATIEVGDALIDVTATGSASRKGDGALVFPDDRSFPPDATVEVQFQP